jgi:oligopeptide transport system substrate-binding protein
MAFILSSCAGSAPATVVVTVEGEGQVETVVVTATPVAETEPVTNYGYSTTDIPTLDPQLGEDVVSINWIENLFVQLTNVDLETNEVVPEAAASWTISEDGLTYTFTIRTDIPWVNYNPITGETSQEIDEEGQPRFVTAHDFEYGIKRACDPDTGSYYSSVVAPQIKGCADVLFAEEASPELFDAIGVNAVDDSTLVIELEFPASYFLTMTPMWTLAATPQWAIEEHGEEWIEAGNIVTDGRYVLAEWVHNVRRIATRNPLIPSDLEGKGNIERVLVNVVPDPSTGYALWLANQVDGAYIPDQEIEAHLQQFPDETEQIGDLAVFYVAFRMTKPPFDDVHVRRAFSAAIDRQLYIDSVLQGQGLPMRHFAPPGIFGAPPIDEVGVGFEPEFANAELELAGYPDCENFPFVTFMTWPGEGGRADAEFFVGQWQQNLGCTDDQFSIEQLPFAEMLAATAMETPDDQAPHMWTLGWGPDYADENNWVGDVLWCKTASRSKRTCNEIDDMIDKAREEIDPGKRIELYRQIEEAFFGAEGEFPFAPINLNIRFYAIHSWYDWKPGLFGGAQWYNASIDQQAQLAARD